MSCSFLSSFASVTHTGLMVKGVQSSLPSFYALFISAALPLSLSPFHFALASGVLVVMESPVSLCELLSLMRLLSHTPYQINRLHQPITT